MTHRWIHPTPRVRPDGERIERGDEFEPTDIERKCWPDRFEAVEEDEGDESATSVIESVDEDEDTED